MLIATLSKQLIDDPVGLIIAQLMRFIHIQKSKLSFQLYFFMETFFTCCITNLARIH